MEMERTEDVILTEISAVTLEIQAADEVVSVAMNLTMRDSRGLLTVRKIVLTPPMGTAIGDLGAVLPNLLANVRDEVRKVALPGPVAMIDVEDVIVLDSFDFAALGLTGSV